MSFLGASGVCAWENSPWTERILQGRAPVIGLDTQRNGRPLIAQLHTFADESTSKELFGVLCDLIVRPIYTRIGKIRWQVPLEPV